MDAHELSETLTTINDCAFSGNWSEALNLVRRLTASSNVFFVIRNVEKASVIYSQLATSFHCPSEVSSDFLANIERDPWNACIEQAAEGEILQSSVAISPDGSGTAAGNKNDAAAIKSHCCLAAVVFRDPFYEALLICYRDDKAPDYSPGDIASLELLRPHFKQAIKTFLTLEKHKHGLSIAQAVNNASECGIVVCNSVCEILSLNEKASQLIEQNDAFLCNRHSLSLRQEYLDGTLKQRVRACIKNGESYTDRDIYVETESRDDVVITILPLVNTEGSASSKQACIIKINSMYQVRWDSIEREFCLTNKERRVAEMIFAKYTPVEIAEQLSVRTSTARTHIQNLYQKLNVSSQVELMAKIALYAR